MANLENNSLDTRTFVQFCEGLSKREWQKLLVSLMGKLGRSAQSFYYWKKGRIPESTMDRKTISDYINREFKVSTRHWTLFPEL